MTRQRMGEGSDWSLAMALGGAGGEDSPIAGSGV